VTPGVAASAAKDPVAPVSDSATAAAITAPLLIILFIPAPNDSDVMIRIYVLNKI
jgi:hypothetical protein